MKNIIIVKSGNLDFYDIQSLKRNRDLRISAVIFNKPFQAFSSELKEILDNIYVLPDIPSPYPSLEPFPKEILAPIVENEIKLFSNTWLISADEFNTLIVSSLREQYNLPGIPYSIVLNFRDKFIQKEVLKKHGIRVPKFATLNKKNHQIKSEILYEDYKNSLKLPFIIKPLDMFGTIGVEKIYSHDQFCKYFFKNSTFSNFIIEEFIESPLYHCDFIIQDNQYIFIEVCEYLHNGLSFLNGCNHGSLLLTPDNPLRSLIIDFCKEANSYLGLKSGCAHFEVFMKDEKEPIFLEAAARPAGSFVPLIFTKIFRQNYMNAALLAEIGENPGIFRDPLQYYFWTVFPVKSGTVKSFRSLPLKSSYDIKWFVNIGDTLHKPSSIATRSGTLVVKNNNYEILKSDFYSLRNFDAIEIQEN